MRRTLLQLVTVAAVVALGAAACRDEAAGPAAPTGGTADAPASSASTTTRVAPSTAPLVRRPVGVVVPYQTGVYVRRPNEPLASYPFNTDAELVMAMISLAIGSSARDTGWRRDERCDGTATRRVTWGELELVFTKNANGQPPNTFTFQQWYVSGTGTKPTALVTPEGVGVGSTVGDMKRAYPELEISKPRPSEDLGLFITVPVGGPFIQGFTTAADDTGTVSSMWAGLACQRIE